MTSVIRDAVVLGTKFPVAPSTDTAGSIGAVSEFVAATDLMRRGYQVYRALSPNAPCDLIIQRASLLLRVEVRTARRRRIYSEGPDALSFGLKDSDEGRFDVLALVIGDHEVYYLPTLPGTTHCPYLIGRDHSNALRRWGVLRDTAGGQVRGESLDL